MSRQDYIVRVRYQNTLPPPPCGPKLVDHKINFDALLGAGALTSLVYSRPLDPAVDVSLGMPIDLIEAPHSFESSMFDIPEETELDPEDAILLEDAAAGVPPPTSVAFLRRTEYSSAAMLRDSSSRKSVSHYDSETAEDRLRHAQESFDKASVPLSELKHPKHPELKAVNSWKFIPDAKQFDLNLRSVRMIGSASLGQNRHISLTKEQLASSTFTTAKVENDELAAFYVPAKGDAESVLASKRDTSDARDDDESSLQKVQDYELVSVKAKKAYEEVIISLDDNVAYYLPVQGRFNLKRARLDSFRKEEADRANADELKVVRADVSAEESIKRDQKRSKFDPVSYE